VERAERLAVLRLRGVAGVGGQREGLERPWVGLGHVVQDKEEKLVGQRIERRRGGAGDAREGRREGEGDTAALGVLVLLGCHGHTVRWWRGVWWRRWWRGGLVVAVVAVSRSPSDESDWQARYGSWQRDGSQRRDGGRTGGGDA
jgi:hypothetical protein